MASAYQAIKKLKMNHLGLYTLHDLSHSIPQLLQSVKKKTTTKAVCRLLNFRIHVSDRAINIFSKFHVKIKFLSKVVAHEIHRETNSWDTL